MIHKKTGDRSSHEISHIQITRSGELQITKNVIVTTATLAVRPPSGTTAETSEFQHSHEEIHDVHNPNTIWLTNCLQHIRKPQHTHKPRYLQTVQAKSPNKGHQEQKFPQYFHSSSACAGQSSQQLLLWLLGLCIPVSANFTLKIKTACPTNASEYASSRIHPDNTRTTNRSHVPRSA